MVNKLYYNYKNQPIGELYNGIYLKKVNSKKHFMRLYQGYGISEITLRDLKTNGCYEIRIQTESDLYKISVEDFEKHQIKANYDDPQIFCPIKWFESKNKVEKQRTLNL